MHGERREVVVQLLRETREVSGARRRHRRARKNLEGGVTDALTAPHGSSRTETPPVHPFLTGKKKPGT